MKLYNTLGRKLQDFKPLAAPKVTLYTCGPTVYQEPHIGNWRTFIFYDTLSRALTREGYEVDHVLNITDVGHLVSDADDGEDKLAAQAQIERKTAWDIAEDYTDKFAQGLDCLNIVRPKYLPRATKHIAQQIELVRVLEQKGFTYEVSDGIYFDTAKLKDYGKLAGIKRDKQMAGARVKTQADKKHHSDFALWKFSRQGQQRDMEWSSPWGTGFPGWHLECSAMAMEYLGETIDIHAGGSDHIGVHHTNEIAQSEAATGQSFASYWLHAEMMMVEAQKMSKSLGNTYLLSDIERKASPMAFRLLMLSSHYRTQQNFTWEALEGAAVNLAGLYALADRQFTPSNNQDRYFKEKIEELRTGVASAIKDDLGTPQALAALNEFAAYLDGVPLSHDDVEDFTDLLGELDAIFGIGLSGRVNLNTPQRKLFDDYKKARAAGNFSLSDELRQQLAGQNIQVQDTPYGSRWRRT